MAKNNYPKAYAEILEILKYLPKEEYAKIPKEKIEFYEENADKTHEFKFDPAQEIANQNTLRETNAIIVALYQDYFANEKQKELVKNILKLNEKKYQDELRKKYNPEDVFSKKDEAHDEENASLEKEIIEAKKESFFKKIINKIKNIFSKNKQK